MAQRSEYLFIDAIELNPDAACQAEENEDGSIISCRIALQHTDIRKYTDFCSSMYDLLIYNPPYIHRSKLPGNSKMGIAGHSATLSAANVLKGSSQILRINGRISFIHLSAVLASLLGK